MIVKGNTIAINNTNYHDMMIDLLTNLEKEALYKAHEKLKKRIIKDSTIPYRQARNMLTHVWKSGEKDTACFAMSMEYCTCTQRKGN